jgi:hypothetical protein
VSSEGWVAVSVGWGAVVVGAAFLHWSYKEKH